MIILGEVRDYIPCRTALLLLYLHASEFSLWIAEIAGLPVLLFSVLAWRPVSIDNILSDLNI